MHAVFIGLDKNLFGKTNEDVVRRHKIYANELGKVTAVVFTLANEGLKPKRYGALHIIPTNSSSKLRYAIDGYNIVSKLRQKEKIDAVSTQDPFLCGLVGLWLKARFGIPLNVQVHTDITSHYWQKESVQNRFFVRLATPILKAADTIRVVNPKTYSFLKYKYPKKRIYFIPIATNLGFWRIKKKRKLQKQIVTVARLSPEKDISLLVSAMAELASKYPDLKCIIIGEGQERKKIERLIEKHRLERNVKLLGRKDPEQIKKIYAKSSIFVLPSKYEGWGLAAVEALATGTPVIMTDTGCAGKAVVPGRTGIVIKIGDTKGLVRAIDYLINNPLKLQQLGKNGQIQVWKYFQPERLLREWMLCLRKTAK